jgi:hypothetical protein
MVEVALYYFRQSRRDADIGSSFWIPRRAGQGVQQSVPLIAVMIPSAQRLDALKCCSGHACLQRRFIGQLLQAVGQAIRIAVRNDESFNTIAEQIFGAGSRSSNHGTAARHGLTLDESQAFLNAGEREDMTP